MGVLFACALFTSAAQPSRAQPINEGFEDIEVLWTEGWVKENLSEALGFTSWFQGQSIVFDAQSAPANSYIAADFESAGDGPGDDTISNWLIGPERMFNNGDLISFWTRTQAMSGFADRLEVRLSLSGSSINVGSSATEVGDFTTLLLNINPNYNLGPCGKTDGTCYPDTEWKQFFINVSGLGGPTSGRFAFRYFVENGGPNGMNSNYIGIDSLVYLPVPEPSTLALMGLSGLFLVRRRQVR